MAKCAFAHFQGLGYRMFDEDDPWITSFAWVRVGVRGRVRDEKRIWPKTTPPNWPITTPPVT